MKHKVKSPFRYPGGKFYALKHLLPYVERITHKEYREPFVGGGAVFFGKSVSKVNWINDIDRELINTYLVMRDERLSEVLISQVERETASKGRHSEIKTLNPRGKCERAFRYFYLNRTSYSGIMKKPAWGYRKGKSSPPANWGNMIINARAKLRHSKITSLDFEEAITAESRFRPDEVLLYLDPPYIVADQKRAFENSFVMKDHIRLRDSLVKTEYYFILSYDNSPQTRDLYKWANIIELAWNYNTSNLNGEKRKKGKELLITNFSF